MEWLKGELLSSVAELYREMSRQEPEVLAESLAHLVVAAFLLGRRLGIGYEELGARIGETIRTNIEGGHELERWYKDFSRLERFWQAR